MNDHSRRSSRSSLRALDLALQFNSLGRHPALGPASLCLRLRPLQPPHIWNLQFKKKNHIGRKLQYSPSYEVTTKKKEKKKPRARFWTTSPLSSLPPAIEPLLTLIKTINHQHRPTRERRSRREKKKKAAQIWCADSDIIGSGHSDGRRTGGWVWQRRIARAERPFQNANFRVCMCMWLISYIF